MVDIATAIAYGGAEGDFNQKAINLASTIGFGAEAVPIISKYAGSLRSMLANGNIDNGFATLQKARRKMSGGSATPPVATKSVGKTSYGEGEFGR